MISSSSPMLTLSYYRISVILSARVTAIGLVPYVFRLLLGARSFHVRLVDLHAGSHRRGHGDALQILALGRGRLRLDDAVDQRRGVVDQLLRFERGLAHRR